MGLLKRKLLSLLTVRLFFPVVVLMLPMFFFLMVGLWLLSFLAQLWSQLVIAPFVTSIALTDPVVPTCCITALVIATRPFPVLCK
ncbi:MAG: hypothetical protein C0445_00305 [Polaromonas sp.]|nr:hypothetical protein [Polaromonas sp.]